MTEFKASILIQSFVRGSQSRKSFMTKIQSLVRIQCFFRQHQASRKVKLLRDLIYNAKLVRDRTDGNHHASFVDDCASICSKLFCTPDRMRREAADCPLIRQNGEQDNLFWVHWDPGSKQVTPSIYSDLTGE